MTKPERKILERAHAAEVRAALTGSLHLLRTRSKLAEKLARDGFLHKTTVTLGGRFPVTVSGYELTHAGRFAYCSGCES